MTLFDMTAREATERQLQALVESLTQRNAALGSDLDAADARCVAAEQTSSDLVKLCVVHERLQQADTRAEVLSALDEIVGAVLGCEEFAVIGRDAHGHARLLHRGPLLEAQTIDDLPADVARVCEALWAPTPPVIDDAAAADGPARLTALVPLAHGGEVQAVLACYRVLPQKLSLEPLDHAVLDLVGRHAGRALRFASLIETPRA